MAVGPGWDRPGVSVAVPLWRPVPHGRRPGRVVAMVSLTIEEKLPALFGMAVDSYDDIDVCNIEG